MTKKKDFKIELQQPKHRWLPDPHRRGGVIPNKKTKQYSRKGQPKVDPSQFIGYMF